MADPESFKPQWEEPINIALLTSGAPFGIPQKAAVAIWTPMLIMTATQRNLWALVIAGLAHGVYGAVLLFVDPDFFHLLKGVLRTPRRLDP